MMKSRGAAVIGAFVLIALAIVVRGLIVGDDDGGGSDGPTKRSNGGKPVVACTPDLIAVCDALAADGQIAADPLELDLPAAAQPPANVDGWITWNPAPQIANYVHSPALNPRIWSTTEALGSAPEVILAAGDTATTLASDCKATTWECLGRLAPELSIGVGDPATAEGIARLAPFARALATDDEHDTLDDAAVEAIVRSPADAQSDAAEMAQRLITRVGSLSMVAGPEALLQRQTSTPAGRSRGLKVIASSPKSSMTVVLAVRAGHEDEFEGLQCKGLSKPAKTALAGVGVATCTGSTDDALAGFLYQVQKKVG